MPPQPPFTRSPGHSGRQPVTSPTERPCHPNLHSSTWPTCCHQKRPKRSRLANLADNWWHHRLNWPCHPNLFIPTRSPHLVVIKTTQAFPAGQPGGQLVASPTKLAMPPQPPFQHVAHTLLSSKTTQAFPAGQPGGLQHAAHTLLSSKTTQAFPAGQRGGQFVASPTKLARRSRPANPADNW